MLLIHGDCLEIMPHITSGSVDLILADLPYGTTDCRWDSVISFDLLWREYWRVLKPNGAIVLTAAQPFTQRLMASDVNFKYNWYWIKNLKTGQMNAKKQPMRCVEEVLIFYRKQPTYNQQNLGVKTPNSGRRAGVSLSPLGGRKQFSNYTRPEFKSVDHVLNINSERGLHPTQKPVALMEYMIQTYSNPGETVLDNVMGSGTTGVAAKRTGRRFIGIERDPTYFQIARDRINNSASIE